jgi:hypothetical protein
MSEAQDHLVFDPGQIAQARGYQRTHDTRLQHAPVDMLPIGTRMVAPNGLAIVQQGRDLLTRSPRPVAVSMTPANSAAITPDALATI